MKDFDKSMFINYFNVAAEEAHKTALEKGWWDTDRPFSEVIAEIFGEVDEIWEVYKTGDKSLLGVEFADVIIRCMDAAVKYDIPIGEEIIAKMEYNQTRPYRHGKEY